MIPVTKAVQEAVKPLTADLVIFRGRIYREREETVYGPDLTPKTKALRKHTRRVLEPVDVELHVNPLGIGLGAAALAAAGLLGIIAWNGIRVGLPLGGSVQIFEGFKNTKTGELLADKLDPDKGLPPGPGEDPCDVLHARWRKLRADPFWYLSPRTVLELRAIEHDAELLGCRWLANP